MSLERAAGMMADMRVEPDDDEEDDIDDEDADTGT
jgi:hypothetical protein